MPLYTYNCTGCADIFEMYFKRDEYVENPPCPSCFTRTTHREYTRDRVHSSVKLSDSELKTVGHLADRNRDSMSSDQKEELTYKHNVYKYNKPKPELPRGMSWAKRK